MKKTSLADLAKSLNVSKTLVSLVLNDKGDQNGISKETQQRVLDKAKELEYKPNQFARGLRLGKSNTIGLVVADISNPFYATIGRSIEDAVSQHGYNLMICSSDENPVKEKELIELLIDRQVDGLIIATTAQNKESFENISGNQIPYVLIDRNIEGLCADKVLVDNRNGTMQAVELFIKNGRSNIAMLSISPGYLSPIRERKEGYRLALEKNDQEFDPSLVREISFSTIEFSVKQELDYLLEKGVDALFISNNKVAVSAINYLKKKGVRIPEEVAIISFDDRDTFELIEPPITAIAQPRQEIGRMAVELLWKSIEDTETSTGEVVLQPKLIVRRSCGSNHHQELKYF